MFRLFALFAARPERLLVLPHRRLRSRSIVAFDGGDDPEMTVNTFARTPFVLRRECGPPFAI
jgi:hypothetical protein